MGEHPRARDWQWAHCGCQDANHFTRDGHYQRTLETKWGQSDPLPVPRLECQNGHHDVIGQFSILEKFQRLWVALQPEALFRRGLAQSLPAIRNRWKGELEHPVGLRTINELINQAEQLVHRLREQQFPEAPAVIQGDGMWGTIQDQEEEIKPDKPQRKRQQRSGKKRGDLGGTRLLVGWQTRDSGLAMGQE